MNRYAVIGAVAIGLLAACDDKKNTPPGSSGAGTPNPSASSSAASGTAPAGLPKFDPDQTRLFQPIPIGVETPDISDPVSELGKRIFFDTALSVDGKSGCTSCHDPAKAGQDGVVSANPSAKLRNTPTLFNAGGSFAQGWDARASTIEEFAPLHALDPRVLGYAEEKALVAHLQATKIPAYSVLFAKAFPDAKTITKENFGTAVGTFTKKFFARSRWDKYLGGDKTAVNDAELQGFAMFVEAGCTSCHQGKYIGGTQTQKLGMAKPWPPPAGSDPGRFAVSKQEQDRGMWKVPTLRNVTRTGPYLHDGSIASLPEIVKLMAHHQVGRDLTDEQAQAIVVFLGTLEGDPPKILTAGVGIKQ